jgi:hypothetical protein
MRIVQICCACRPIWDVRECSVQRIAFKVLFRRASEMYAGSPRILALASGISKLK